jgi:hypothetical protein
MKGCTSYVGYVERKTLHSCYDIATQHTYWRAGHCVQAKYEGSSCRLSLHGDQGGSQLQHRCRQVLGSSRNTSVLSAIILSLQWMYSPRNNTQIILKENKDACLACSVSDNRRIARNVTSISRAKWTDAVKLHYQNLSHCLCREPCTVYENC